MAEIASVVRQSTLRRYRSILDSRILPVIGGKDLADVDNKTAKLLVGRLAEARLSPSTIGLAVTLVKQIVKSAVDGRGNPLYPVIWNGDYIKAPQIDPASQKAPITASGELQTALDASDGPIKGLIALLAGSALRINEALAIGCGNVWDPRTGTVAVNGTLVDGEFQPNPKTKAGKRVVDLAPEVNVLLRALYPGEEARKSVLFPLSERTYRRRLARLRIPGFHSLRRFRITHLQLSDAPETLIKFWAGHAAKGMTERYTKVGSEITARKTWSEKVGIGVTL